MDIHKIRLDSPNTDKNIFLDSAGSSLMPSIVTEKVIEYLHLESVWGGYKVMMDKTADSNLLYSEAAKLLNCAPTNIAFANNATDAYTKAISSIHFQPGDVILTTDNDYVSNYMCFISLIERNGVICKRIKSTENGDLDLLDIERLIAEKKPKLIAITHMPTNSGLIQDAEAVGKICANHNILYILDACQSVGQINVDVKKMQCDFLSITGRKFLRAPRGTGLLYVSDKILSNSYSPTSVDGWSAQWTTPFTYKVNESATRFEHFEKSYAMMHGMIAALQYANTLGIDNIESRNKRLNTKLRANLNAIPTIKLLDLGSHTSNIVTFIKEGISQDQSKEHLSKHNVINSFANKFSALIDFEKKGLDWAIRFSPHYFNTIEEMDQVAEIIESM